MATTVKARRQPKPRHIFKYRCSVPLRTVVKHPARGDVGNGLINDGGYEVRHVGQKIVRYAIEWNQDELAAVVARAASNQRRFAKAGPVTIYIHPDD